jgi:hypothetical protein
MVSFRSQHTCCPRDGAHLVRSADDPLIGTTVADRYVIEALVGEGAMGLVYRAHHARLSRLFAVKLMFGDVAADPAMRMRFAQEADVASRLCHPNVVSVVDFGRSQRGLAYLAMDYVDGETLASLIRREAPLAEHRVIALAQQMCRGLGHAHRAGLVHRDFKPANVALAAGDDGSQLARILDFGLAISEREGDRVARLTEHGLVVGTPIYISPEQAKDQPVDHRADLFALGVVMYEMLTGMTPFDGSGAEIARANVQQKPPPLGERNPSVRVTPELEAIVYRLLEKRAADRFQDAEAAIEALGECERSSASAAQAAWTSAGRLRAPALWLTGRPTRRWKRTGPPAAPGRPAPAESVVDARTEWHPGRDAEPTMGMAPPRPGGLAAVGQAIQSVGQRGVTLGLVLAIAVAGLLAGGHRAGTSPPPRATKATDSERPTAVRLGKAAETETAPRPAAPAIWQLASAPALDTVAPQADGVGPVLLRRLSCLMNPAVFRIDEPAAAARCPAPPGAVPARAAPAKRPRRPAMPTEDTEPLTEVQSAVPLSDTAVAVRSSLVR